MRYANYILKCSKLVFALIIIVIYSGCTGIRYCEGRYVDATTVLRQLDIDKIRMEPDHAEVEKYHSQTDAPPEVLGVFAGSEMAGASYQTELSKWSKAVRERDDNVCFMCGKQYNGPAQLEAHHILPKADYREISLCLWNGITLCKSCHDAVHGKADNWIKYVPIFYQYTLQYEKDGVLP